MAQQAINVNQALALYSDFLSKQIAALAPAERNLGRITVTMPNGVWRVFSFPQMLGEVQRRTQLGMSQAVSYANALGYVVM
jgi:hypothetical protein